MALQEHPLFLFPAPPALLPFVRAAHWPPHKTLLFLVVTHPSPSPARRGHKQQADSLTRYAMTAPAQSIMSTSSFVGSSSIGCLALAAGTCSSLG